MFPKYTSRVIVAMRYSLKKGVHSQKSFVILNTYIPFLEIHGVYELIKGPQEGPLFNFGLIQHFPGLFDHWVLF